MTEKLGRRGFFKKMGLGAAGVAALPVVAREAASRPLAIPSTALISDIPSYMSCCSTAQTWGRADLETVGLPGADLYATTFTDRRKLIRGE